MSCFHELTRTYHEVPLQAGIAFGECRDSIPSLISWIKSCSRSKDVEKGKRIDAYVTATGQDSNIYIASSLVDMYANCGNMVNAERMFNRMQRHDVVSWNTLIMGYVENGDGGVALHLFGVMQQEGYAPNMRTFLAALKACISVADKEASRKHDNSALKLKTLKTGMAIHAQALNSSSGWDMFVESAVVDMYAKCGNLRDAARVFDTMQRRDVVSWTILIMAYADNEQGSQALDLYVSMRAEECRPTGPTFAAVLRACVVEGTKEVAVEMDELFVKLVSAEIGMSLHCEAVKFGYHTDIVVNTSLIEMYSKVGLLDDATRVFRLMKLQDVIAWNMLISGHGENGKYDEALELFTEMSFVGCAANARTYIAALQASAGLADLKLGKAIHMEIFRQGLESHDLLLATSLVDFYGRVGNMEYAERTFDQLSKLDKVLWSALIAGYSHTGNTDNAVEAFHMMRDQGLEPDGITVVSVIAAYNHAGLVEKGKAAFRAMSLKYGITPDIDHYHCMIDMLGRAGQLDEALELVQSMPFPATAVTWTTILSKCRKWNNVRVGKVAFDALVEIDEKKAVAYVLMANNST